MSVISWGEPVVGHERFGLMSEKVADLAVKPVHGVVMVQWHGWVRVDSDGESRNEH